MSEFDQNYQCLLEQSLGVPFTLGNDITVLKNGMEIFPAMLEAIRQAEERIEFLTFVYWTGNIARKFAKELAKKSREGVDVYVILDSYGASPMAPDVLDRMEKSGVQIEWFRPIKRWKIWNIDNRTHRKVLICDGKVGFTGGVGIAEEWEGDARNENEWRDTHFRIEGPAVYGLQAAFMENWIEAGRELRFDHKMSWETKAEPEIPVQVIRTSASVRWSDIMMLYQTLIKMVQKNLRITTAYFNPNDVILDLLKEAAGRGVDIQIILPGKQSDKQLAKIAGDDNFEPLLDAGIDIWYYQKTMMHAKVITVDNELSCVGSANLNHRSMLKDDEVNVVILDKNITAELNEHFSGDLKSCEKITEDRWKKRGWYKRSLEKVTGILDQQI